MEILKLVFGMREDGVWEIQGMKPVPLKPAKGHSEDYYAIADGLFLIEPKYAGTVHWTMSQSIVPIVAHVPGEAILRCLGTGFFVSCSGLLITAAHVVTDPIDRKYGGVKEADNGTWDLGDLKIGVMIPLNPIFNRVEGYIFREILWAGFLADRAENPLPIRDVNLKLTSDTAICMVAPIGDGVPHQPLSIVQRGLRGVGMAVGKTVSAVGYVGMQDVELFPEKPNVMSGEFKFELHVSRGEIIERFPDNAVKRDVPSPGACFSASIKLPPGMSGSPMFDSDNFYVHGVVSKGWDDENGAARFGYGSMLAPSLALPIMPLNHKSLLDLMETIDHGIPMLNVPDL